MSSSVFRIEIRPTTCLKAENSDAGVVSDMREAGLSGVDRAWSSRVYLLEGAIGRREAESIASDLIVDPVTERWMVAGSGEAIADETGTTSVEVHLRPGVMDPVAETTLEELRAEGHSVESVRTARRYFLQGEIARERVESIAGRVLANDCIERVVLGSSGAVASPVPPQYGFKLQHVAIRELSDEQLAKLSRDGHLFLSLDEMQAIRAHFRELGREPTDLELETLAQTWSEHCVHKTLKSAYVYRGAAMPSGERHGGTEARRHEGGDGAKERQSEGAVTAPVQNQIPARRDKIENRDGGGDVVELEYDNLLKDTIARVTQELMAEKRGPECLSVFKDNAGIIAFDDEFAVAIKVETHNHPSAIEPYGGAATGAGGCIRDVLGCGLAARPIANTDVFCVAPSDWSHDSLPKGVLHPWRVLRGVVKGVADYGNRMGIPTVNGAVHFDPRFLGNPLVFCGCIGLIPRDKIHKAARPGDKIVVIGGRTGRDGIHGATFSSAELTDTHADEFSHAVQIGNAITEKRCVDAVLAARDHVDGCLFTAITDCGAGGLSSAVGEMGEDVGASVDLDKVTLKYAGLRYDEIWISEAQERMVLSVSPDKLDRFMAVMRSEQVEATVIGEFGSSPSATLSDRASVPDTGSHADHPQLIVRYAGTVVGQLDMHFMHRGIPSRRRVGEWQPAEALRHLPSLRSRIEASGPLHASVLMHELPAVLRSPGVASKEWIIRQYDHEVQGGSAIKSIMGRGRGPTDAAVLRPRPATQRAIAIGCGLTPELFDIDPYWMAAAAIDEALCNVVAVGGDPDRTAILDNFCWGKSDDAQQLGALIRTCQACYDTARAFGTPFISGKDSLNNEFALDPADVEKLIATIRPFARSERGGVLSDDALHGIIADRLRTTGRLRIPGTLLVTAMSLIDDVSRCVSADLKADGDVLLLVGGLPRVEFSLELAAATHRVVAAAIQRGVVRACHDCSSGWLVALAEMAIGGDRGATIDATQPIDALVPLAAGFVVHVRAGDVTKLEDACRAADVPLARVGTVSDAATLSIGSASITAAALRSAWAGGKA
ncbi:MAG: phosphoribosylformylglycinamidine synthase subunit PurS [Phycisphaerae bacterium]